MSFASNLRKKNVNSFDIIAFMSFTKLCFNADFSRSVSTSLFKSINKLVTKKVFFAAEAYNGGPVSPLLGFYNICSDVFGLN